MIIISYNYSHSKSETDTSQITFEKRNIKIGSKKLKVEVARSHSQLQQGLMHRAKLGKDEGMIFIFDDEDYRSFWMKNTLIDLSIGFFNKNYELVEIIDMKATSIMDINPPSYPTQKKAQYAVEANKGWFKNNNIRLGDKLVWD